MIVKILGEKWHLLEHKEANDPALKECDGYMDSSTRTCVIGDFSGAATSAICKGDLARYKRQVARHELLHAFLYESGLAESSWAANEEMVDFFAIQWPKIARLFEDAGAAD